MRDHMRMDWISLYRFTYLWLYILLLPHQSYERWHANGLNCNGGIHLFRTLNLTFRARMLLEITWQWAGGQCMDSLISDCKYYFCRKNIITDHIQIDWISLYGFTYFRLYILLFPQAYY
jgi:hypothetical protein